MKSGFSQHFIYGLFGLLLGLTLSFSGFSDFAEVHGMFTFTDFRLLFLFAATLVLAALGFAIFARDIKLSRKSFNKGTIPGSILFGIGWAITGACPSIALVQLGEGQLAAFSTILGILFGVWIYRSLTSKTLQFDTSICGED